MQVEGKYFVLNLKERRSRCGYSAKNEFLALIFSSQDLYSYNNISYVFRKLIFSVAVVIKVQFPLIVELLCKYLSLQTVHLVHVDEERDQEYLSLTEVFIFMNYFL